MKVLERLLLGALMPKVGNFITMETALGIKDKVMLSPKERDDIELKFGAGGSAQWDPSKDVDKPVEFSKGELSLIESELRTLEKNSQLSYDHIELYRAYVLGDAKDGK